MATVESMRPIIGITTYVEPASWGVWHDLDTTLVPHAYTEAVTLAGGRAVLLPPDDVDADLPVLGVCRGMQVLTVAAGGTLHQHLPDVLGHEKHRPAPGVYGHHEARFEAGSRVAALMGDDIEINCYHHQGVADPGTLTVTGRAEDGLPEAVEDPAHRFVLGVQWHPEVSRDRRLFGALVNAAAR